MTKQANPKKQRPPPTPKAPKPWDVPPLPKVGNHGPAKIFRCVGRALDSWEHLEIYLGTLFAVLLGLKRLQIDGAMRAYGSVLTSRGRLEMVAAAADIYFRDHANAELQERLDSFLETTKQFGARRNEIAHGIVERYGYFVEGKSRTKYVLGPSLFATNKRIMHATSSKFLGHAAIPKYLYTSIEIDRFSAEFEKLRRTALTLYAGLEENSLDRGPA